MRKKRAGAGNDSGGAAGERLTRRQLGMAEPESAERFGELVVFGEHGPALSQLLTP